MHLDRKYVIAAAVVGYVAWALITDWLPSLRWIPYAFIAGALVTVLAALWLVGTTSRGVPHSRERDADALPLAPEFVSTATWDEEKASLSARAEYRRPTIFPEAAAFSKAVDALLSLVLRSYVTSWYGNITKRLLFQNEIDRCIRSVLLTITARLTELDVVEVGVASILPIITAHLKDFYDAERALRGKDLNSTLPEGDELDVALAAKYKGGRLHAVASLSTFDATSTQQDHVRSLVVQILPLVLPDNMKSSPAVLVLIREIVSCAVLAPFFALLSDPDFLNQMIVQIGGPMLQDRKTVRKVRAALDQHALMSPKMQQTAHLPKLKPYDSERHFERFIRAIRHVGGLSDARRYRSEVMSQLRKDAAVEGQEAAYLRRLETGRRLLDQRITSLSTTGATKPKLSLQLLSANGSSSGRKANATLREVIYDAAGLSYFMEYMDRHKLMRLVQFFLVVDGFRNPLEGDNDELPSTAADDPGRMDIAQMYEGYLTLPELDASETALRAVRNYLNAGPKASIADYTAARSAVLQTQTQVYKNMRVAQFENFRHSDLYFKWLAIDDVPALAAVQSKQTGSMLSPDSTSSSDASPIKARRPPLGSSDRGSELRRAVLSSTDLMRVTKKAPRPDGRRSLDESNRAALFEDDVEDERMTQSLTSIGHDDSDTEAVDEAREAAKAVNAMQSALDDIVGQEHDNESVFSDSASRHSFEGAEVQTPLEHPKPALATRPSERAKLSIASLGLVGAPSSRGMLVDDLFGEEAKKFSEDEREGSNGPDESEDDRVREAAPGDLGLSEAIDVLSAEIERLNAQKGVLDSLTAKAELTNNTAELRILRKSEQSLQREIRRKEMQKQQYIVQESDNSLYGRAAVSIKSVMVGREEDGREYALYIIEVRRQAGDQIPAAVWAVTRRFSQFHELHKRLRARFPAVKDLDFPRRQALFTLQKDFIQKRRVILERYLRSLLLVPAICHSRELRAFLSQSALASQEENDTQVDAKDFVTRIYNSVSDGMEEFLGNIPVLDQLSVAGQNLISAATAQMNGMSIDALDPATHDPATAAEAEAELNAYETKEAEPFVKPICDLFLEAFELSRGNNWLRGRTVVVVLHQLLGGTIERRVRETAKNALQDESSAHYVDLVREMIWPGGQPRPETMPRTPVEKARTRKEASLLLGALVPDMAGSVVGKSNARAASRKIVAMLNNQRLNTHLIYTLADEVIKIVFPETNHTK